MAAHLADHQRIFSVNTVSGQSPRTESYPEKAGQTFVEGTPVQLNAGVVQAWDGNTVAIGILGIVRQDAANLGSDGLGAPGAFGSIGDPGAQVTFGKVSYQTSAYNIPVGSPMTDGRDVVELADQDTLFEGQVDHSNYVNPADATTTLAMVGAQYGMTKDATGHWYVDMNKHTVGADTVVVIEKLSAIDGLKLNGRVWFRFIRAAQQIPQ